MITEKILVVDDEENISQSVRKILSRKGYAVDNAKSVEEAINKIQSAPFDLVITDLMMPKTTGMELLQIIRDYYPDLAVIMITGYASIESAVKATKLGAEGYLPKPFTPDELMQIAEKALQNRKSRVVKPKPLRTPAPADQRKDETIDVDMPFSVREVSQVTSKEYVEALTHSDIPVAKKKTALKAYCSTGKRDCVRLVKEGRECPGECPIEKKDRERATKAIGRVARPAREIMDVDMPFPLDEVAQIVGSDYINCLDRSDIVRAALYGRDATAKHSVLVIDDEPIVCHSVRKVLVKKQCAVEEAFDVDAALQKMRLNRYDLIILDLKMPKRSGIEVLRSIKSQWPDLPVIMLSGYGSIDTAIDATRLGALNFISKPFTPDELVGAAEEALIKK